MRVVGSLEKELMFNNFNNAHRKLKKKKTPL